MQKNTSPEGGDCGGLKAWRTKPLASTEMGTSDGLIGVAASLDQARAIHSS